MHRLLIATRNLHKTREFAQLLGPFFYVRDLTIAPEFPAVAESGRTFEENAILKAVAASKCFSELVAADDSGLEVDALNGAPGIYSARYAGENASDEENVAKVLAELTAHNSPAAPRVARFRCALALARDGKLLGTFDGAVEGTIVETPRGRDGFGYDPIFVPQGFDKTFGEVSDAEKNRISHRARAIHSLRATLDSLRE